MKTMPLVNVFQTPYEVWDIRRPTHEEMLAGKTGLQKTRLIAKISNHFEAAKYELLNRGCTRLDQHIEDVLNSSIEYKGMRELMPSQTDQTLSDFQNKFQSIHFENVSNIVQRDGKKLVSGQILYHGGFFDRNLNEEVITTRPLSTSFSPHMACQNAEWRGKAYDSGELHLMMFRVVNPQTKAFCFKIKGTNKGHEKEVLFASGAKLVLRKKTLIKNDGTAYKACDQYAGNVLKKSIPFYLLEIDIS
ncbi:TPA: hypothetical protein NJ378_004723 [Vibrio parahaemolyticus]|nr:hypothetical protein [Vibrio parahaemolyticus]